MTMNVTLKDLEQKNDAELYELMSTYYYDLFENMNYDVLKLMEACNEKQFSFTLARLYYGIAGDIYEFIVEDTMRKIAIFLEDALNTVGAYSYAKQLARFVEDHGIDLDNIEVYLQKINSQISVAEEVLYDMYDFCGWPDMIDKFERMNQREPLEEILVRYIRNNLEDLLAS